MRAKHAVRIGVGAALGLLCAVGCALVTDLDPLTEGRDLPSDAAPADSTIDTSAGDAGPGSDGAASSDGASCEARYREMVLAEKPVAYWRLGDAPGETRATDESGNGNHGTYRGGIELGAPGAIACDSNHAMQNDSTGSVTVDDHIDFAGTAPMTLEVWAAFAAGDQPRFVGKSTYTLFWWSSGVRFDRTDLVTHCACIAFENDGGALLDDRYHHFVATYDSYTMKVYVDGNMIRNCPCDVQLPVDAGTLSLASNGFAGKLDEVAVYDKALPTPTIQAHFDARAP